MNCGPRAQTIWRLVATNDVFSNPLISRLTFKMPSLSWIHRKRWKSSTSGSSILLCFSLRTFCRVGLPLLRLYRCINREEWTWRALRLLSRRCGQFYTNWNPPGRPIKHYLTNILTEKLQSEVRTFILFNLLYENV